MVTYVLVEAVRQLLENCPMTWLKIDFDNMGNRVPVRRSGDPRDACRIEAYHARKSILIAGIQRCTQQPRKWCHRAGKRVAQNVRWTGRLIPGHFGVPRRSGTPPSKINGHKM